MSWLEELKADRLIYDKEGCDWYAEYFDRLIAIAEWLQMNDRNKCPICFRFEGHKPTCLISDEWVKP